MKDLIVVLIPHCADHVRHGWIEDRNLIAIEKCDLLNNAI